jgi:hypothetical protein
MNTLAALVGVMMKIQQKNSRSIKASTVWEYVSTLDLEILKLKNEMNKKYNEKWLLHRKILSISHAIEEKDKLKNSTLVKYYGVEYIERKSDQQMEKEWKSKNEQSVKVVPKGVR